MRSNTWLPIGIALLFPGALAVMGCDSDVQTTTGGTGGATTTDGGGGTTTSTTSPMGGGGTGGTGGSTGGTGGSMGGTGGSMGGTGGTGGVMPPSNDLCNGENVPVAVGVASSMTGTLIGATDNYATFCSDTTVDADKPEVVYELDIPAEVTATFKVSGDGFNPVFSLRKKDCSNRMNGDACFIGANGVFENKFALSPGKIWVMVESAEGSTGDFALDMQFDAAACGDGVVNAGEKCDPAVVTNDDGCVNPGMANGCQFGEAPPDPAIVACPGGVVQIGKSDSFQLGPFNNGPGGSTNQNVIDPMNCGSPAAGPENVFNIKAKGTGILTAEIGYWEDGVTLYCEYDPDGPGPQEPPPCGDFVMYLRQGSCSSMDAADQMSCDDYTDTMEPPFFYDEVLTINAPVTADTDYWLIVDGLDDVYGVGGYYLKLSLQ